MRILERLFRHNIATMHRAMGMCGELGITILPRNRTQQCRNRLSYPVT